MERAVVHTKSVQSLNRRLKGWKAERKSDALPVSLSAFQHSSLLPQPAFPTSRAKPQSAISRVVVAAAVALLGLACHETPLVETVPVARRALVVPILADGSLESP